jgi:N-acetylglucosamine kinase-like BadF-type ATPase
MRVIGLDSGGTKTVCYLADETGAVLAEARGAGAHLTAAGVRGVEAILREVITAVMGERPAPVDALCLGMAGVDRPGETALVRTILDGIVRAAHVVIVNDALVALEAGAPGEPGIVIISGTGSIAYGRDGQGRAARSGGWGYVLADEGSGYWLGRQALRAVMRESDGRGPRTSLTARLLAHYHVERAQDLVRQIYTGHLKPAAIATLASTVQAAADEGDEVATRIIEVGAAELTGAAASVARQLQLSACTVVLAGGIFRAVARMRQAVSEAICARLPGSRILPLDVEPAIGAVRLAIRAAAGEPVTPSYVQEPW